MNELYFHDCKGIVVSSNSPENGNSISLTVTQNCFGQDGEHSFRFVDAESKIVLFGLPVEVTDKLIAAFGEKEGAES